MDPLELKMLLQADAQLEQLALLCDQLGEDERTLAIRALSRKELALLFAKAEAPTARIAPDFFVPSELPAYASVEWRGRNSLALFSNFLKVITRGPDGLVFGWNANGTAWAVGPGYFTVKPLPEVHQLRFDYTDLPKEAPPGWPKVKSNRSGGSYFIYRDLMDHVRPIGQHVVIAAAHDAPSGKALGYYFALARGPILPAIVPAAATDTAAPP